MSFDAKLTTGDGFEWLNVYAARLGKAWLVHVRPTGLPSYLERCLDEHFEARAMALDFDDLETFMLRHGAVYGQRAATTGGVELAARGEAAKVLGRWLAAALASGVRTHSSPLPAGPRPQ
jgi:hypothetical protein